MSGAPSRSWPVEFDTEFSAEFDALDLSVRKKILAKLQVLQQLGPTLGRPHADTVNGAKTPHLKELIVQVNGDPWRIFFGFNKERVAILLCGGNKGPHGGSGRWYDEMIALADKRAAAHSF